jgi:ferredoxin
VSDPEIVIDSSACAGSGICSSSFPELFALGDDGIARAIPHAYLSMSADDLDAAITMCPMGAISVGGSESGDC